MAWEMVCSSLEKAFGVGTSSSGVFLLWISNEGNAALGPGYGQINTIVYVNWNAILELLGAEKLTMSFTRC